MLVEARPCWAGIAGPILCKQASACGLVGQERAHWIDQGVRSASQISIDTKNIEKRIDV